MRNILVLLAGIGLVSCTAEKPETASKIDASVDQPGLESVLMAKNDGCHTGPMEQFGRYIGDWDIQDWQLSREDGKTWTEQKGARWNFTCVGDGIAVQDFWMPNTGGKGTNLRIYNAETESWDIVWTATGAPGTMQINAKKDEDGKIVMNILSPKQNPPRRIIFYPPTDEGWDWASQMQFGEPAQWVSVYKIKATRR
jgi:hypothetical protein